MGGGVGVGVARLLLASAATSLALPACLPACLPRVRHHMCSLLQTLNPYPCAPSACPTGTPPSLLQAIHHQGRAVVALPAWGRL